MTDDIPDTAEAAADERKAWITVHPPPRGVGDPPRAALDYATSARCPDCLLNVIMWWNGTGWNVQIRHAPTCPLDGQRRQHPSNG